MSKKHKSKLLALLEFHVDGRPFNTQEATDFLNAYKSKYIMINPNKGKNKCAIWKYVGEEE